MKKPNVNIFQVSVIPPNIEDNTTAVVIYLDISISHLPNSFFITLVFVGKDTHYFPFHQMFGGFSRYFFHIDHRWVVYIPQMVFIDHRLTQIGTD